MRSQLGRGIVCRTNITGVLILSLLSVGPTLILAQKPPSPRSPREVLQAYREMDSVGGRLTPKGWYRGTAYFVKPARPPSGLVMAVMKGERVYPGPSPWYKGGNNRVKIEVDYLAMGQIDSLGRFTSMVAPELIDHTGRPLKQPATPLLHGQARVLRPYLLVLTDAHWEFGPNGEGPRELKGPPEWRIENFEFEPNVTIDAAIRYLTKLRTESQSEAIKKNADNSIATLLRLKVTPAFQTTQ